ncbi:MAG TPA: GDSL-type esterase/lipase family protein [Phototrophicaceae bacterium]|nr:GDSL-type esterase/lipase family protein [Phototrophicaceae bacterium]
MSKPIRTTLIILLNTVVILLVFELLARAILWRTDLNEKPAVQQGFGFSAGGSGDLLPNLDVAERLLPAHPYYLKTNSVGLRNTDELNDDPNVFRVLAVGDSFMYGMYVHNQETFPARLEETLNQWLETSVQVLNAGVPGYTIADELDYLRDKGLKLQPDLVILGFYTNDIFDFLPEMRQYFARSVMLNAATIPPTEISPAQTFLQNNIALYNLYRKLRGQVGQARLEAEINRVTPTVPGLEQVYQKLTFLTPDAPEYQDEWQTYEKTLRETLALLAEQNIPVVLVAWPDLSQMPLEGGMPDAPQQMLARVTGDTETPFLNLLPVYRDTGDITNLYLMHYNPNAQVNLDAPDAAVQIYSGDGHPSSYGHLVAARAMADLLAENGLMPP